MTFLPENKVLTWEWKNISYNPNIYMEYKKVLDSREELSMFNKAFNNHVLNRQKRAVYLIQKMYKECKMRRFIKILILKMRIKNEIKYLPKYGVEYLEFLERAKNNGLT